MTFWSLRNKTTTCTVLIDLNKQMLSNFYFCFQSCLSSFHTTTGHRVKDYWSWFLIGFHPASLLITLDWKHSMSCRIWCSYSWQCSLLFTAKSRAAFRWSLISFRDQLNPLSLLPDSHSWTCHQTEIFAFGMWVASSVSTTWEPLRLTSRQLRSWKYRLPCIQTCSWYTVHRPHFGILVMLWHPVYDYFVFKGIHVLLLHLLTRVCQKPRTKALWISGSSQGCSKTLPCKFDLYGGMLRRQDIRMLHSGFLLFGQSFDFFSSQVESS